MNNLSRRTWKEAPQLLGLKVNDVKIGGLTSITEAGETRIANLRDLVSKELEAQPDLLALWSQLEGAVQ